MTHDRFLMTDDRFRPQVMAAERALDELEDHAADRLGAARRAIIELERTATAALQQRDTVPRVIAADELKPGQWIAFYTGDDFPVWETLLLRESDLAPHNAFEDRPIVLLEDAPAEKREPVKVGDTISTEEQLKSLPPRTVLRDGDGNAFEKAAAKWWMTGSERLYPSDELIKSGHFTVLHLPEEDA